MLKLAIKTLIILLAISSTPTLLTDAFTFIFLLLVITITSLCQYYNVKKLTFVLIGSYALISLFYPQALMFLPVLFFDLAIHLPSKYTIFLPLVFIVVSDGDMQTTFFRILTGMIALLLSYMSARIGTLDSVNKEIRDTNASQKIILTMKNQELLERQNDAIHMTKLQERNRIARDIHDTIGHSLSRALLQTGALSAINQDAGMQLAIDTLKETLTNSMNSIRNSIHDLKDEGIDLKSAVSQILDESGFKTSLNYDVDNVIPHAIKSCFLIVLKESITNTRKHSDATRITVTIVEHPAMYQFLVADNGTKTPVSTGRGIGLQNIGERINELDGYCRMSSQGGFRTFITIPKKENVE